MSTCLGHVQSLFICLSRSLLAASWPVFLMWVLTATVKHNMGGWVNMLSNCAEIHRTVWIIYAPLIHPALWSLGHTYTKVVMGFIDFNERLNSSGRRL